MFSPYCKFPEESACIKYVHRRALFLSKYLLHSQRVNIVNPFASIQLPNILVGRIGSAQPHGEVLDCALADFP